MTPAADGRRVTVCAACLRASCWWWDFPCDATVGAGTTTRTIAELRALDREHPSYFDPREPSFDQRKEPYL
jgi:hypothetical protein